MKQQKEQIMTKLLELSEGSYSIHADEHTKIFMNNIEKARSIYTKI